MSDLTKDKVERAIAEINPNPPRYGQGIPSPEAAQTALAALDAVRWRNIALSEQNAKLKSMADEYHALDMAIDALMQQSEPTEPCYYCRDLDGVNCYQRGTLYRKGEEINSVPARYCMNCGRRIKP